MGLCWAESSSGSNSPDYHLLSRFFKGHFLWSLTAWQFSQMRKVQMAVAIKQVCPHKVRELHEATGGQLQVNSWLHVISFILLPHSCCLKIGLKSLQVSSLLFTGWFSLLLKFGTRSYIWLSYSILVSGSKQSIFKMLLTGNWVILLRHVSICIFNTNTSRSVQRVVSAGKV